MPNYSYKCSKCSTIEARLLPMSTDPQATFGCSKEGCDGRQHRIIAGDYQINMARDTVGKWYKKQTGKELLGGE
jgi:2-phospho-L-lactate transferase/gluconeogenesis factor (CofD/UPF0052 family)